jgi:hypothetical protein
MDSASSRAKCALSTVLDWADITLSGISVSDTYSSRSCGGRPLAQFWNFQHRLYRADDGKMM